eukprot:scaffold4170_cov97-Skeletonema_menzelii.AAC.1
MKSSRQNGTCFGGAGVSPSPYFTIALSRSLVSLLLNQQKRVEEIHTMKSNNIIPFIVQNTFIPVTGNEAFRLFKAPSQSKCASEQP